MPEQCRSGSAELKDPRVAAQDWLESARSHLFRLEDIERGKEALVSNHPSLVSENSEKLDEFSGRENQGLLDDALAGPDTFQTMPLPPSRVMMSCHYLDGDPFLQRPHSRSAPCLRAMVAKK